MELNCQHQTCTTNLLNDLRILSGNLLQSGFQKFTLLCTYTRNIILQHIFDRCNCSRTSKRISAECRRTKQPWIVDQLLCPHFRFADDTCDWHDSASKCLTICHNIRSNTLSFTSPHRTGTSHTSLNLIKDQCYAILITDLAHFFQITFWRNDNSCLTLNRLKNHSGNLLAYCLKIPDGFSHIFCISILHMLNLLNHWCVRNTVSSFSTHRNCSHRFSVESSNRRNIPASTCCDTRKLQCHLNGLCTTVCKEAILQISRCDLCHRFCKISTKRVKQLLRMQCLMIQLRFYNLQNFRISVSACINTKSAKTVDEFLSI